MDPIITELVRDWVRIKITDLDDTEIRPMIESCINDLRLSGIKKLSTKDPLIRQCIKLYARAEFNFDGIGDKYREMYKELKNALGISMEYTTEVDNV